MKQCARKKGADIFLLPLLIGEHGDLATLFSKLKLGKSSAELSKANNQAAVEFSRGLLPVIAPLYEKGEAYAGIAAALNKNGILSFRGKKFHSSTIRNMIGYLRSENLL